MATDTIAQFEEKLAFHQKQVDRYADALALLRDEAKVSAKATKMIDAVRAKATGVPVQKQPTSRAFVEAHRQKRYKSPIVEARRLLAVAEAEGLRYSLTALLSSLQHARKGTPMRSKPMDAGNTTRSIAAKRGHKKRTTLQPGEPTATQFVAEHADFTVVAVKQELQRLAKLSRSTGFHHRPPGLQAAFYAVRKLKRKGHHKLGSGGARPNSGPKKAVRVDGLTKGQRKWAMRKSGDTPINRVRRFLIDGNGSGPYTREQIEVGARLSDVVAAGYIPQATARILAKMADQREVKQTPDGWVPLKVQAPDIPAAPSEPTLPL